MFAFVDTAVLFHCYALFESIQSPYAYSNLLTNNDVNFYKLISCFLYMDIFRPIISSSVVYVRNKIQKSYSYVF